MHALSGILSVLFANWRVFKLKDSGLVLSLVIPLFFTGYFYEQHFPGVILMYKKNPNKPTFKSWLIYAYCTACLNLKIRIWKRVRRDCTLPEQNFFIREIPLMAGQNSDRKLCSRNWLIWNKMALQLKQRTPPLIAII